MRKKIRDVLVGCWYVCISEFHLWLVRVHIFSPDPDPIDDITYKLLTDDRL